MVMKKGTKSITVRLPEEEKFLIERSAFRENRSVNNFIVNAVKTYIEQMDRQKN